MTALGSPALGICNVATGRLHAYWALELSDLGHGRGERLILTRAGGTLTDELGASWLFSNGGYIASNSIIHGWTLRSIMAIWEARRTANAIAARAASYPEP